MDIFKSSKHETLLRLETEDFTDFKNCDKLRGYRFKYVLIPEMYKDNYSEFPVYKCISGTIYMGTVLRANITFY